MPDKALKLYPLPAGEVAAEEIYRDFDLSTARTHERRDPSRPYVMINMVSSVDGKTTADGRAFRIGSEVDRSAMRNLRAGADAVMIGAATLRAERLSLGLDEAASGSQPLAVIITKTGDVPLESNLIRREGQRVLVFAPKYLPEDSVSRLRRLADVIRTKTTPSGSVDLQEALKILKTEHATDLLLVEGGPSLNHALVSASAVDEIFLTLAPKLLGGTVQETLTMLAGPQLSLAPLHLLTIHLAGDELYLRYVCTT